jgi:hypothetical protein
MDDTQKEPLRKVQIIAPSYYSRKDIQIAIFNFCKNREVVGNFNNKFFGKRPDCLDYPSDIINLAKQGVTSIHCSEELWSNPLDISTDMTKEKYDSIRIGWDFLIDIDAKYLDYAKVAAIELIKELETHGIENYGIKYSGSKGFHIIIPFKAFPKELGQELAKNCFPEWPRSIANYLKYRTIGRINERILQLEGKEKLEEKGDLVLKNLCPRCGSQTETKTIGKYVCRDKVKCKGQLESMKSNRKEMICSNCYGKMDRVSSRKIDFCPKCNINTAKLEAAASSYGGEKRNQNEGFKEEKVLKSTEESVDLVLVSPRHLFRVPYSLHEKTALASIVIEKKDIEDFKPSDADPLKIKQTKSFMPPCIENEAKELLLQAMDWASQNKKETKKYEGESIDISGLTFTEEIFPPIIKKILEGIKSDGRKRALSILLSFYSSLGFPADYMEEKAKEWNKKNYHPLKEGYIKSQVFWYAKNKRLPPNYDKPLYKLFGSLSSEEQIIKNPINYTIKKALKAKSLQSKKVQ